MYIRVTYDNYIEGEYDSELDAAKAMLEEIKQADETDMTIETFNEETAEWE
jgi:hypothetical protein